jgi:SulP family sulfate permease
VQTPVLFSQQLLDRLIPCRIWLRGYSRTIFAADMVAAVIVTLMLIPQSLAYALLAGLPAETGLYASILPLVAYALFGTSRTLSVGPVAVISLMTAAAIGSVSAASQLSAVNIAILLALLSGVMLLVLGVLRFGFLANFLSHPVVAGFITASGVLIALSQVKHLLGIAADGDTLPELLHTLAASITNTNLPTLWLGLGALAFLFWARSGVKPLATRLGFGVASANLLAKAAPVFAVVVTTLLAWGLNLPAHAVAVVGTIPSGLPALQLPALDLTVLRGLLLPAFLISVIGYVESVSVGRTLGTKRREKIDPDQELIGLGAANLASAFSGGFPVTGGFSRSVVNFDAGAQTQAAGIMTALGIGLAALLLTPLLAWLPNATLAATIVVAVLSLLDFKVLKRTWDYSISDFIAVAATMGATLLFGVETGVSCGVAASLLLHLYTTSRPHIAEVGEIAGTGHFRNIRRHAVVTHPEILALRIDESLYFGNASYIEDEISRNLQQRPELEHVVLVCTAVNSIDMSALEVLESLNTRLREQGIGFHLSEVKGPVMDALQGTHFLAQLNGHVFLTHQLAVRTLLQQQGEPSGDYEI